MKRDLINHLKKFVLQKRLELFEEKIQQRTKHICLVLEDIYQGRNISASIRSADCFGVQDIHVIENSNNFEEDSEVSLGSEKWVSIYRHNTLKNNTLNSINKLKKNGYQIIGTTIYDEDISLYDLNIDKKTALIFGSEMNGCSNEILSLADKKVKIPMYGFTESFNISVAVALSLQHLTYKMRKSEHIKWKLNAEDIDNIMLDWLKKTVKSSSLIEKRFIEKNK